MTDSLFSKGQASTIGLQRTSISPLPTAYTATQTRIPAKGSGNRSGRNASPKSPRAERTSEATIQGRYPILSTRPADRRSVTNCVRKNTEEIRAILASEIP